MPFWGWNEWQVSEKLHQISSRAFTMMLRGEKFHFDGKHQEFHYAKSELTSNCAVGSALRGAFNVSCQMAAKSIPEVITNVMKFFCCFLNCVCNFSRLIPCCSAFDRNMRRTSPTNLKTLSRVLSTTTNFIWCFDFSLKNKSIKSFLLENF